MTKSKASASAFLRGARAAAAAALVLTVAGCLVPGAPGPDPTSLGHAKWCEQSPPSGYCVVGEPH